MTRSTSREPKQQITIYVPLAQVARLTVLAETLAPGADMSLQGAIAVAIARGLDVSLSDQPKTISASRKRK